MALFTIPFLIKAAIATTILSTGVSIHQAGKAERASKRAAGARARLEEARASRVRAQQLAEARRTRAQAIQQGETAGVAGGSGIAGAVSATQTQLGANLSFLDTTRALTAEAGTFEQAAATARGRGARAQVFGSAATSVFSLARKF